MDDNVIQFIPRPNPERERKAVELKNVQLIQQQAHEFIMRKPVPDDPSEYAMDDDTAPAEYVAPDRDGA